MSKQTPSQTVGPFFHVGLIRGGTNDLLREQTRGQRILLRGQVIDGNGDPVTDAMLEIWQADADGIYRHPSDPRFADWDPHFHGFGRVATGQSGEYHFKTIMPGETQRQGDPPQAPHINLRVFARGMLIHVYTRIYFPDQPANQADPVLSKIADQSRRQTLIATKHESDDLPTYGFDIRLQGSQETVFFDP